MIQLRLGANGQEPDLAVYAQHRHAEQRPWNQVERVGEQPVVYPARGSHACYFSRGVHWTGDWFDNADGQRPGPALDLRIISDTAPADAWATWPGMWGGTQPPPDDLNPLDDSSPRGPGEHAQYLQPDALLQTAIAHQASLTPPPHTAAPPPAPGITAVAAGKDLHINFDTRVANPAGLVVTVGDLPQSNPPEIHRVPVDGHQRDDRHPRRRSRPGERSRQYGHCRRWRLAGNNDEAQLTYVRRPDRSACLGRKAARRRRTWSTDDSPSCSSHHRSSVASTGITSNLPGSSQEALSRFWPYACAC